MTRDTSLVLLATILWASSVHAAQREDLPNIVVCMADDWSWPHAGTLGDPVVKTPHFDRIASEGVLFENAFVSTPSCTPSRLSILTGQHHWRLREGDSLGGSLREEYVVYTEMLEQAGYRIGRFGKGVWPSKHTFRGRDSFGKRFGSFDEFLIERQTDQPLCFWLGSQHPHRPYEFGVGRKNGMDLSSVKVPACLPDNDTVRGDIADYLWEVQRFDQQVGEVVARLKEIGEFENTIFVVSSDNGMPFPRCKATLYDQGTRVPLAIRWASAVSAPQKVSDFVSLCDLAPTFLEAAGLKPPASMTGRSLMPLLESKRSGQIDQARSFVLSGLEKHVYAYPSRSFRTADFLFIRNFDSHRWPTGEVDGHHPEYDFATEPWPTERGAFSFNIDPSPSKQFLRLRRDQPDAAKFANLSLGGRPEEELYDLREDPAQLVNVATVKGYETTRDRLRRQLDAELIKSDDPRLAVAGYTQHSIEGWPVRVSDRLMKEQPSQTARALELLAKQLNEVKNSLPAESLAILINVPIWLSPPYDGFRPTGEYHPNAKWLKDQGRHPQLHQCVEFTNTAIFQREVQRMPVMVLHELAHAYHDQVLGFDHPQVRAAYDQVLASGIYDAVQRKGGKTERAYAMATCMEYFAETSEAFFGVNDFYPFTKRELQRHDPKMAELLARLWGAETSD